MSEYQNQKTVKPKIEDVAPEILDEDKLKGLSEFLEFLKANKLTPRWLSTNSWKVMYKNKCVCFIRLNKRERLWNISHSNFTREKWFKDYERYMTDNEVKEYILNNIKPPLCTDRDCKGRQNMTILGKKFDSVCNCVGFRINNPNTAELENSKKLILVIKNYIADLAAAAKA